MDSYLSMVQSRGVPLPPNASNFAKHLLAGMLSCNLSTRFSCIHAVREIKNYMEARN